MKLIQIQIGPLRLIGKAKEGDIVQHGVEGTGFELHNAGVMIVQRGQRPGAIQGTVQEVKLIQIATLDFARGPVERIFINNYDMMLGADLLDEKGRADMEKAYQGFLDREPSVVDHHRPQGELP